MCGALVNNVTVGVVLDVILSYCNVNIAG